jgi:hypothetical protein
MGMNLSKKTKQKKNKTHLEIQLNKNRLILKR